MCPSEGRSSLQLARRMFAVLASVVVGPLYKVSLQVKLESDFSPGPVQSCAASSELFCFLRNYLTVTVQAPLLGDCVEVHLPTLPKFIFLISRKKNIFNHSNISMDESVPLIDVLGWL